jgi:hypothetical protein
MMAVQFHTVKKRKARGPRSCTWRKRTPAVNRNIRTRQARRTTGETAWLVETW